MANTASAEKAMRQSERRRVRNRVVRAQARTEVKDANKAIEGGSAAESAETVKQAIRALDQAAQKGVIKKNNAARRKARLMKKLNALTASK